VIIIIMVHTVTYRKNTGQNVVIFWNLQDIYEINYQQLISK